MRHAPRVPGRQAFSLAEMLVVVSIIGVLAAVAVPGYNASFNNSKAAMARNICETLNRAVHRFNEGNYELVLADDTTGTTTEFAILRTLQYRDPLYPRVGSPYMRDDWNPTSSNNTSDYRVQWTGTLFKLLTPGTAGWGLKLVFDCSDLTTHYQFPTGYTPVATTYTP